MKNNVKKYVVNVLEVLKPKQTFKQQLSFK